MEVLQALQCHLYKGVQLLSIRGGGYHAFEKLYLPQEMLSGSTATSTSCRLFHEVRGIIGYQHIPAIAQCTENRSKHRLGLRVKPRGTHSRLSPAPLARRWKLSSVHSVAGHPIHNHLHQTTIVSRAPRKWPHFPSDLRSGREVELRPVVLRMMIHFASVMSKRFCEPIVRAGRGAVEVHCVGTVLCWGELTPVVKNEPSQRHSIRRLPQRPVQVEANHKYDDLVEHYSNEVPSAQRPKANSAATKRMHYVSPCEDAHQLQVEKEREQSQ